MHVAFHLALRLLRYFSAGHARTLYLSDKGYHPAGCIPRAIWAARTRDFCLASCLCRRSRLVRTITLGMHAGQLMHA